MTFLNNLIKSEEELKRFTKDYDEHIGLNEAAKKKKEPERKFQFGVILQRVTK